jgi:hypothetical protein
MKRATRSAQPLREGCPRPADHWFYDHALPGLAIVGILVVLFGPVIGLLAAFVHVNICLGGSGSD